MGVELSAPAKAAAVSASMVSDEDAGRPSYLSPAVMLSFSSAAPGFSPVSGPGCHGLAIFLFRCLSSFSLSEPLGL